MANRDRHRQGLIYGPVRPSGPRDRGRIFGNLLGLLVVVVTLVVLALAIYFFAQQQASQRPPAAASATPTATSGAPSASASASPSASATATSVAVATVAPVTPPPTAPPTPAPTDVPIATPEPTIFVPAVVSGPGFITFGTTADAGYHVSDPKTTFAIDEPMVWSAHLSERANAGDLRIRIFIQDATQPSGQRLFREDAVTPDATAEIFFRRLRPIGVTAGAGLFTIEYVRGDQVLAQGSFLVQ